MSGSHILSAESPDLQCGHWSSHITPNTQRWHHPHVTPNTQRCCCARINSGESDKVSQSNKFYRCVTNLVKFLLFASLYLGPSCAVEYTFSYLCISISGWSCNKQHARLFSPLLIPHNCLCLATKLKCCSSAVELGGTGGDIWNNILVETNRELSFPSASKFPRTNKLQENPSPGLLTSLPALPDQRVQTKCSSDAKILVTKTWYWITVICKLFSHFVKNLQSTRFQLRNNNFRDVFKKVKKFDFVQKGGDEWVKVRRIQLRL